MCERRVSRRRWSRAGAARRGVLRTVAAGLAAAQMLAPSPGLASPDETVEVVVSAVIPERCGLGAPARAESPMLDLESAQALDFVLPVECNAPFAVAVQGEHGRLLNITSSPDDSGYAFDKAYGVRLTLRTDQGLVRSDRCVSSDIVIGGTCDFAGDRPGQGLDSGGGVAVPGEVTLSIDWPDQSSQERRLAAGEYRETITLTVGART